MPVLSPVVARAFKDAPALREQRASSLENEKRRLGLPGVMQEVFKLKDYLRALLSPLRHRGARASDFWLGIATSGDKTGICEQGGQRARGGNEQGRHRAAQAGRKASKTRSKKRAQGRGARGMRQFDIADEADRITRPTQSPCPCAFYRRFSSTLLEIIHLRFDSDTLSQEMRISVPRCDPGS